ncbi:DUF3843 family protein [Parabacteroides sp. PF5-9]|uniref:DUF3843 family protein n=1 Tax=Parabacteroides sp. PF5-9 TaxID=1742404 RepID=UPI0024734783|nr:DUF3843 family protein [Parabacteroides sp. PF5-9]MDH6358847.1 hypothetical protein [Parabacteroides sp. PF5-9]
MKNLKIYPKEWLEFHPYTQTHQVDIYYTGIANRICDIFRKAELTNSYTSTEAKQICMRLTAYFEDIVSQTGIWQAFIKQHHILYGSYLPFYPINQEYYMDEVNLEDVRFLVWHFTQQYYGTNTNTFIDPEAVILAEISDQVFHLFSDEWAEAPENEKMQKLFAPETRYNAQDAYESLLFWFYYDSYLMVDSGQQLNTTMRMLWEQGNVTKENANQMFTHYFQRLAYNAPTAMLALTAPQWLELILPEAHPDKTSFKEIANGSVNKITEEVLKRSKKDYNKFIKTTDGQPIVYFTQVGEMTDFLTQKLGMSMGKDFNIPSTMKELKKLALYAVPEEGVQILSTDLEAIKDEHNPFYEKQPQKAVSFFLIKHCSVFLLQQMMERGMLEDASIFAEEGFERGKAIIQNNWRFIVRYFLREYPQRYV